MVARVPASLGLATIPALYTVSPEDFSPLERLTRARYPNGDWELDQWGLCSTDACLDIGPAYNTNTNTNPNPNPNANPNPNPNA